MHADGRGTGDAGHRDAFRAFQRSEATEHLVYERLAGMVRDAGNAAVLREMAAEELAHARFWQGYTGEEAAPDRLRAAWYLLLAWVLGVTFAAKLMERGEHRSISAYRALSGVVAGIDEVVRDEEDHERALLSMLSEERLAYMGSIVLGLNDALIEFSGSLAGFTFALRETRLVAAAGIVMGIAAALSMASSEYLSQKSDRKGQDPSRAALYTGAAYIATVLVLVLPFVLAGDPLVALGLTIAAAILVIAAFSAYVSVTLDTPLWSRFAEMAVLSLGIAGISFLAGIAVRALLHVDV
ncbi:MAG: VIT1/CCC1 family protein [Methanolinea sp.]|nr:VIT1/CCC1 family protein [Methanolinea sp.]